MLTDDQCWSIVQQRDSNYDGVFYVAVMTTKIYCRPSCGARPLRKNVRFYAHREEAQAAGLRPCKRCHPDNISPEVRAIHIICRQLESQRDQPDLATLAQLVGYSPYHLTRMFKAHLGVSPKQYGAMIRRQRLRAELAQTTRVGHATLDTGFQSLGAMYADAPLGMPPRTYQHGGKGIEIAVDTRPTPFGVLVVATTTRGVCFVGFVADDHQAEALVQHEYPHATIRRTPNAPLADAVHDVLITHPNHHDIPIDIKATAFQQRVWHALRHIPVGQTRSYQQIAGEIGQPRAVRAVANACAQNPVAILVPCHRVIRSDGGSGGYRWSNLRKQALLAHEHTSGENA